MKKLVLFLLVLLSTSSFAQKGRAGDVNWFGLKVNGGFGTNQLINKNLLNGEDRVNNSYWNPSHCYGGGLMFQFTNKVSLGVEAQSTALSQNFDVTGDTAYGKQINITSLDIPILLRFTNEEKRNYAELGVSYSMLKSVTEKYTKVTGYGGDITPSFSQSSVKLVMGVGIPIFKGETFDMTLGMRMNYTLKNITTLNNYPFQDGLITPKWPSKTGQFSALAVLEFRYSLGYFATSSCGKRKGFILF